MALELLSQESGWQIADPNKDLRGWRLVDRAGKEYGAICELLIDTDRHVVASVRTETGRTFALELLEISESDVVVHDHGNEPGAVSEIAIIPRRPEMIARGKELKKTAIHATDGDIGKLHDIYFDDAHWTIRYLVIATSASWLGGRKIRISPGSILPSDGPGETLSLNLTREQIRNSPDIETDQPVLRQHENEFAHDYVWPVGPVGRFPATGMAGSSYLYTGSHYSHTTLPVETTAEPATVKPEYDPHLRSAREVSGYHVSASDGEIGRVEDFEYELGAATVRGLVIDAGSWVVGRTILIPVHAITEIREDRVVQLRNSRSELTIPCEH